MTSTKNASESHEQQLDQRPPHLFTLRFLVLTVVSLAIGTAVGVLTWLAVDNPWSSVLAGFGSAGVALSRLNDWTEP